MKKILAFLCIFCMILSMFSCQAKDVNLDVVLNEEKSYFSDFKIENDKVYIYCTLFIKNKSDTEKVISLNAFFEKDVELGLLKEALVSGYSLDESTQEFQLKKGENQLDVVFVGEYAGVDKKNDRLLPDIEITEIK